MKKLFILIYFIFSIYGFSKYKVTELYNSVLYGSPYCYDASIICADSGPISCTSGNYITFSQCGLCSPNPTDGIGKHTRNSSTGQWIYNGILLNCYDYPYGVVDEKFKNDGFGGPDVIKDTGPNDRIYLFYSHGNADIFKGSIEYKYGTTSGNYSQPYKILSIADENISSCTCCGGVARVAAVDMGLWFYIYFETWIGHIEGNNPSQDLLITCPAKYDNCQIGHYNTFLFRIRKKNDAPYIELSQGNGFIYKKSTSQWISMNYDSTKGYVFGYEPNYPNLGINYFADNVIDYSIADVQPGKDSQNITKYYAIYSNHYGNIFINISEDGKNFNWEEPIDMSLCLQNEPNMCISSSLPGIFQNGLDLQNKPKFFFFYSVVKPSCYSWWNAYIKSGLLQKDYVIQPKPRLPYLKRIIYDQINQYLDENGDKIIDKDMNISLSDLISKGFGKFHIVGDEDNGYLVLYLYEGCKKEKDKKYCTKGSDEKDFIEVDELPNLYIDPDMGRLYIYPENLSIGDEYTIRIILRAYDEMKEDKEKLKKEKKCKKDDTCIEVRIKIVE